jgi:hypothetical protein
MIKETIEVMDLSVRGKAEVKRQKAKGKRQKLKGKS